jgi:hypothetical protein
VDRVARDLAEQRDQPFRGTAEWVAACRDILRRDPEGRRESASKAARKASSLPVKFS